MKRCKAISSVRSFFRLSAATALAWLPAAIPCAADLQHGFFAVHCEPLVAGAPLRIAGAMNLRRPELYWDSLANLVSMAQSNGHCLTIMFTPQWAVYAAARPDRRLQLAEWTAAGHELAVHHHGPKAVEFGNDWDGFSNDESFLLDTNAFGDVPLLMAQGVFTNYPLLSATTENGDWPEGIRFSAAGGSERYRNLSNPGDLVCFPSPESMAGLVGESPGHMGVWSFRMRLFTTASTQTQVLHETQSALADCAGLAGNDAVLGYVTHAKNFHDTGSLGHYQELFTLLDNAGVRLGAVSNVAACLSLGTPMPPPSAKLESAPPNIHVDWDTTGDGLAYQLQQSGSLQNPNWSNCLPVVVGNGSNHCCAIGVGSNTPVFFRIVVCE